MTTQLTAIEFTPGINKNTTDYGSEKTWVDGDKVRWKSGKPEKIGGWVREVLEQDRDSSITTLTAGKVREAHSWVDLVSTKYLAMGGTEKVELFADGKVYNITPYREEKSLTDVIATTSGESEVSIYDVNHGFTVGEYLYVDSQASAVDGITLSGEYVVTEVTDLDNFVIDSGTAATGSTSGGGGLLEINYYLENGDEDNGNLTGYSGGTWNTPGESGQGYNRPRDGVGGVNLRQWSFDNWGEDLIGCVREGKIYHWDATNGPGVNLQEITTAPSQNSFILIAQPSRYLVAFGSEVYGTSTFDPLVIRWADQESLIDWDIETGNTAGEYRLPKGNYIVGAVQTRSEILVFTDTDVYSMTYIGGTNVFQFEPMGTNSGLISQHGAVDINGIVIWMGVDSFYIYDGVISTLPATLDRAIFDEDGEDRLLFTQKEKTFGAIDKEFNEVVWFYPSEKGGGENDSYVAYNYLENSWYSGTMCRTVWVDKGVFAKPYAVCPETNNLYIQETGKDANGAPMEAWIQTGMFDIEDGTNLLFVDKVVPDIDMPVGQNIEITLYSKKYPHPTNTVVTKGPFSFNGVKGKISCRLRGRQMSIKISSNTNNGDFRVGKMRIAIQPDGGR